MANTSKRGFASMDASKQREIASKGGRAAHAKGTAHEFTSDEARVAGRKGGEAVSRDREHMSAIGREGGHSRGNRARLQPDVTSQGSTSVSPGNERRDTAVSTGYGTQTDRERPESFGTPSRSNESSIREQQNDRGNNDRGFIGRREG
jgi:general stress protein YciG